MKVDLFITEDGSSSLRVPELDETYHSSHGAIQESKHVFIGAGLVPLLNSKNPIRIFEVGFGTGLNAFLTLIEAQKSGVAVEYLGIEKYPVAEDLVSELNYPELLNEDGDAFLSLHNCQWNIRNQISPEFEIEKLKGSLLEFEEKKSVNLIYFDAFGPDKQPEMWSLDILKKCYEMLEFGGIFVTYSAKGQLKRDLKAIGFKVETLPGPPGKFQMTRAIKLPLENTES